ncbi:hypothetical protein EON83_25285 [bacterium]|nr:MAG: hypothetical protein EON83_25285 [bacterium]
MRTIPAKKPAARRATPAQAPVQRAAQGTVPGPLQAGTRIIYEAGDSVVQGVGARMTKDDQGNWVDTRGNRWREDQLKSSGGVGYTALDIVQASPSFVAADVRNFLIGFNNATTLTGGSAVTGNGQVLGDSGMKYWISPARLAQMKNGKSGGHQVRRLPYSAGRNSFNAISISDTTAASYANEIYDLKTGILLSSSRSSSGGSQFTLGAGNTITTGAGASAISHLRFIGTRKKGMPWANSPAPSWAKAGTRLAYNGQVQNVMYNSGFPPAPPTGAAFSCVIHRVAGGCVLVNTISSQDNGRGLPPSTLQSPRVYGTLSSGSLWVPPVALQKLRPGQIIDQDQLTHYNLTYAGIQNGVALFLDQGTTDQWAYAYNPQNGMLVGFDITTRQNNMGEQRRQYRLAG